MKRYINAIVSICVCLGLRGGAVFGIYTAQDLLDLQVVIDTIETNVQERGEEYGTALAQIIESTRDEMVEANVAQPDVGVMNLALRVARGALADVMFDDPSDRPPKQIALTFDDGPHTQNTPYLLDILGRHDAKATFYVNGYRIGKNTDLTRRIVEEGHEIGNHTRDHPQLTTIGGDDQARQLDTTTDLIQKTTGVSSLTLRPPYGAYDVVTQQRAGMPIILWSLDTRDRKVKSAELVADAILSRAHDGAIVLLHDTHRTSVDAMPAVLEGLQREGYEFVTVSEILGFSDETMEEVAGRVYVGGM